MQHQIHITKEVSEIIVDICQCAIEYNRFYNEGINLSANELFKNTQNIAFGLRKFIASKDNVSITSNLLSYKNSIETSLSIFTHLDLSIANKKELICILKELQNLLIQLETQLQINLK